jgi:hypothetical protein
MRKRRHHNNKGLRQIKRGKTQKQVAMMAKRLGGKDANKTVEKR